MVKHKILNLFFQNPELIQVNDSSTKRKKKKKFMEKAPEALVSFEM